jgi:regulator of sirC expression with transglutaminase-like and TPR domain
MTREEAEDALADAGSSTDDRFPLFEAALSCALHEDPERDPQVAHALLDQACERLHHHLKSNPPDEAICEALGGDCGLSGDLFDGQNLANADLISVCERRRGLSVTLAVVYLEAARRSKLDVQGVDFPGHFLLRVETDDGPIALDPFAGGQVVMPSDLIRRALRAGLPPSAADDLDHLMTPIGSRQVALRLQDNLFARAGRAGDYERAERAALRRALLDPKDHRAWLDVAAAREGQGQIAGALQALDRAWSAEGGMIHTAMAAKRRMRLQLN